MGSVFSSILGGGSPSVPEVDYEAQRQATAEAERKALALERSKEQKEKKAKAEAAAAAQVNALKRQRGLASTVAAGGIKDLETPSTLKTKLGA